MDDDRKSGGGAAVTVAVGCLVALLLAVAAFAWLVIFGIRGGPAP